MSEMIRVTASTRIEAHPDVVRAQYRDIDHHIRTGVHPSIEFHWEPGAAGQRKIRTSFRILGIPQFDLALLEDTSDGSLVIRYVEGTNAGMVVTHEFVPLDGGKATEVRLTADAPATLGRKLLGPLFKVGARQVLKKALAEDKADLEKGTYRPGKAAGNVARALAPLDTAAVAQKDVDTGRAILSAACLVVTADAAFDDAERSTLGIIAMKLGVENAWMDARVKELAKAEGLATTARDVGVELAKRGVTQEGLVAAATAALVSDGMSIGELAALRAIADGARFADEDVGPIIERADAALQG
jgi:hypothetical protein